MFFFLNCGFLCRIFDLFARLVTCRIGMESMFHFVSIVCKWQTIQVAENRIQVECMWYRMISPNSEWGRLCLDVEHHRTWSPIATTSDGSDCGCLLKSLDHGIPGRRHHNSFYSSVAFAHRNVFHRPRRRYLSRLFEDCRRHFRRVVYIANFFACVVEKKEKIKDFC